MFHVKHTVEKQETYDIIVVGAGHAGCEAAAAAAKLGSRVLLITMSMTNMAKMSCNPSIGGIAKGQIIREIDAMGGLTGVVTDLTMIQFRILNRSKGPAMWSPRAQNDRMLFSIEWRRQLEKFEKLDFWQDAVTEILVRENRVSGVKTVMGMKFYARAVILANGTFLNGIIHIGEKQFQGGRMGERSSKFLTESLKRYGIGASRMKTGTPVRVDGRTLDFSKMAEQKGDENPGRFSFLDTPKLTRQRSCFLAFTTSEVHDVLRTGFGKSPLFTGRIKGTGPRYCPSIEDKIERFADKERHQLFIEPEGWDTVEYYVNGFSSSLPEEVQFDALRRIKGFEHARFFRPGYAIEYDYFPPHQLSLTLESRILENLYLAGQINGTTGYEEAAAQGFMAGINAHLKLQEQPPVILKRSEAYIGVLIDDLITKGTEEPYRMFTSRAEYRILLRQDNADYRLTPKAHKLGLAGDTRMEILKKKYEAVERIIRFLRETGISPEEANPMLTGCGTAPLIQRTKLTTILLRPQISLKDMAGALLPVSSFLGKLSGQVQEAMEQAELLIKYNGYIKKEQEIADKLSRLENMPLKQDIDYHKLQSLSSEAREKLSRVRPETIGQAARISGVSPADISVLIVHHGR